MSDRRRSFASTSDLSTGTLPSVTGSNLADTLPPWADDLECAICGKLLYEPVTTSCGHTFCRSCLTRALDSSNTCAMCRTVIHLSHPLPITRVLHATIARLLPAIYAARAAESREQQLQHSTGRLPLFPLSMVVFPRQKFVLHIFEPRYRLMLRRVLAGSRRFGLIQANCDIGCVIEVLRNVPIPDGRSIIETVARSRFRVRSRGSRKDIDEIDGYLVGAVESYIDRPAENIDELVTRARAVIQSLANCDCEPPLSEAIQKLDEVPPVEAGPDALGLWLAGLLTTELSERQRLLEMRDSTARLIEMTELLEKYAEKIARDGSGAAIESRFNRECVIS